MSLEEYYNKCAENSGGEEERLNKDNAHKIEFITTMHFLKKHLPAGISVLDCCAGCGAYAFPLAKYGYRVTARDLIERHIDYINENKDRKLLVDTYCGSVLDMSRFEDNCFDCVLCMGALYHLQTKEERNQCVKECIRVLKPGGIFVFSYINRNAIFINHFKRNPFSSEENQNIMKYGKNGIFYGMEFNEAEKLAKKFKLNKITDVGVDGLIYPLLNEINTLDAENFEHYMRYHLSTCEEPSVLGHSMHGLWIGKK